ncbi:hypothetical protein MYSTI_01940 [Myxococcus stipitatus DSM 14675]|uniref:ParB-like N-terminal domain-containing protein n=1 Tax=Myxococcus stipitatus (strain DSM 14675 / JCM 12634 / Mx s8) TaxID=1278073 RepID=L7U3A7_MYXSD|nr:ParB N-terminal domain-containing protein [Myxococcus stipitatus]AGC43271.1 hypothetical protein MYSTI_01940 [Myxococcus stipitatus DSM 14675]
MDYSDHVVEVHPFEIFPRHEVRDAARLERIATSMAVDGWVGRPLLAIGDQGVTGSHRLAAARRLGVEVPVVVVDECERLTLAPRDGGADVYFDGVRLFEEEQFLAAFAELGLAVAVSLLNDEMAANNAE